jgi:hypothetical protein
MQSLRRRRSHVRIVSGPPAFSISCAGGGRKGGQPRVAVAPPVASRDRARRHRHRTKRSAPIAPIPTPFMMIAAHAGHGPVADLPFSPRLRGPGPWQGARSVAARGRYCLAVLGRAIADQLAPLRPGRVPGRKRIKHSCAAARSFSGTCSSISACNARTSSPGSPSSGSSSRAPRPRTTTRPRSTLPRGSVF